MNWMIVFLLLHGLAAMFLLGALTHQAASCWRATTGIPRQARGVMTGIAIVRGPLYTRAIIAAYLLTMVLGDVVYGPYRVDVKTMLFDLELWGWNGVFEIKEHLVALGFFLLVPYAQLWVNPASPSLVRARLVVTTLLAAIVWYALLAGHLLNNLKGVGQ